MSKRRWGRGGNQTQSHDVMSGVLRWTPSGAYGDYARHQENMTALDKVFVAARTSACLRKRPITLATKPFDVSEDK